MRRPQEGRYWKVIAGGVQSAVIRAQSPMTPGRLRVWLTLYGAGGGDHFGEFTLSATKDAEPSLASRWEPLVALFTKTGELSRDGYRLRIAGESIRPCPRVDFIQLRRD